MQKTILVYCQTCEEEAAKLVYEPKYKGFRGRCPRCGGDWPES